MESGNLQCNGMAVSIGVLLLFVTLAKFPAMKASSSKPRHRNLKYFQLIDIGFFIFFAIAQFQMGMTSREECLVYCIWIL